MKFVVKKTFVCGKKEEAREIDITRSNLKEALLFLDDKELPNIRHLELIQGNKVLCSWNTADLVCLINPIVVAPTKAVKTVKTKVVLVKEVKKPVVKAKPVKKAKVKK